MANDPYRNILVPYDNSEDENAARRATNPAITKESIADGPARPAATPLRTKMPAPMMFAIPIDAAPKTPTFLFNVAKLSPYSQIVVS